jgi:O-antigen/teichoic acid export membrane protein
MTSAARIRPALEDQGVGPLWRSLRAHAIELSWVLGGKGVLLGANTLLMLLLARQLTIETYGLFATVVGAQMLASRVLLLGLEGGIVRLMNLGDLRLHSGQVVRGGLHMLRYTCAGLLILTVLAWPLLHDQAGHEFWPSWAVAAAVVGSVGMALVDYAYFCRLAELGYRSGALLQGAPAFARLVLTATALYVFSAWAPPVFFAYAGVSLLFGLWQAFELSRRSGRSPLRPGLVRRLARYSVWPAAANVTAALSLHQGTFLLAALGMRFDTGLFGLALTLSLGFFALKNAFYEYLFPRMMQVPSTPALPHFLGRSFAAAGALTVACIPVLALVGWMLPRFIRPEMWPVVGVLYYLGASMLLLILQAPLEAASHYLMRPDFVVYTWLVRVAAIGVFGLALVPSRGVVGAAVAQLAGGAVAFGMIAVLIWWTVRGALRTGQCPVLRATGAEPTGI